MKFLMIDGSLLSNKELSSPAKLIIAYLHNLGKAGKSYFGGLDYLSDQLGLDNQLIAKVIHDGCQRGLLKQEADGLKLNHPIEFYYTYYRT